MNHNVIKSMLVRQGIKQSDIAAALGLTRSTVSAAINGHRQSRKVKRYIADLLNKDYAKLWGKAA